MKIELNMTVGISDAGGFVLLGALTLVAPILAFAAAVLLDHIVHGPNR